MLTSAHVTYSPSLTLYWDRPFEEEYTDSEGMLEHARRKTVRLTPRRPFLSTPEPSVGTLTRSLQVFETDPVRTTPLTTYIAERLRDAEAACGGAELQGRYLSKADPLLMKQIYDVITGNRP